MDDVAITYRWSLSEIGGMSLPDLARWWARARVRLGADHGG